MGSKNWFQPRPELIFRTSVCVKNASTHTSAKTDWHWANISTHALQRALIHPTHSDVCGFIIRPYARAFARGAWGGGLCYAVT